ncbi:phosphate ABC transporter substrate-binding protein PstS [Janibacter sp. G1551]|uniref:phosphate ABC transporter substrate-binding protein PstS n=1 Tax=Janibacter sp. G1551 TaxID=3420440 RepID=UPI003D027423
MKRSIMSRTALPAALALSLTLAACGASNEAGSDSSDTSSAAEGEALAGSIAGIGASSKAAAEEAWIAAFGDANPDAEVTYDPQGSGAGREQFIAGAADFAGSDSAMDEEELAAAEETCGGPAIQIPVYISPIAIAYNLEGVDSLQLSPETAAKIFDHKITTWNDAAIKADNPDVELPDTKITTVNRSDESGTSKNFAAYLADAAPKAWSYEPDDVWPVKGGSAAKGTSGVVSAIEQGTGTIGYADASQIGDLGAAKVKVGDEFVEYSAEAAAKITEHSKRVDEASETNLALELDRATTEAGVYPVDLVSYAIACSTYKDAEKGNLVKAYLTYVNGEGQQVAAEAAGSAPISASTAEANQAAIDLIKAG